MGYQNFGISRLWDFFKRNKCSMLSQVFLDLIIIKSKYQIISHGGPRIYISHFQMFQICDIF